MRRLVQRWPLWLALALVALFSFERISDMDAGWLLSLGREVARGHIPSTNTLSWVTPGTPWYPTNWLFDLVLYGCWRAADVPGIQLFTFAAGAAALLIVRRAATRAGAGASDADAATLLAVGVFWTRLTPRPHLFEYLCEALILERCLSARDRRSFRPLLALPLIIGVWTNAHQSAPFGLAVAAACLADVLIDGAGWDARQRKGLFALLAVAALALFATPGLQANLVDLTAHLRIGEVLPILEHERPTPAQDPAIFLLGAAVLGAAWISRARWTAAAPALLFAGMTFGLGRRFGGDLALLGVVPLALAAPKLRELLPAAARSVTALTSLAGLLLLLRLGHVPVTALAAFVGPEWDAAALPVEAVEVARARGLGSRGFHAFRFGGYVGFVYPEAREFQDGRARAFPEQFWRDEKDAMTSPAAFSRWLDRLGATWALTAARPAPLSGYALLDGNPAWERVHADATAEVWVRRAGAMRVK